MMNTHTLPTLYFLFSVTILSFPSDLGYFTRYPNKYPNWVPNVFNRPVGEGCDVHFATPVAQNRIISTLYIMSRRYTLEGQKTCLTDSPDFTSTYLL